LQQLQQADWIQQQLEEKRARDELRATEKALYDQQNIRTAELRKALDKEKADRLTTVTVATKEANVQQLDEKLDRDRLFRHEEDEARVSHVEYITNHDFYTENTGTCQSMLGRHRVIPYHWKGMNDEQRRAILLEQERQRKEKEDERELEKEKERLYAAQEKHLRRQQLLADKNKNRGGADLRRGMDEYNRHKAEEMKRKIPHAFGEIQTFKNE
jgi:hypothetical protein